MLVMKIIYNNIIPFSGFKAIMLFGVIFARKSACPLDAVTVNHEAIHRVQSKDCGGWAPFYIRYLWLCVKYGYRNNPFEREAYDNDRNMDYLKSRTPKYPKRDFF
jgi:hypothetical protein